jgi:adenylate cyclase
MSDREGARRLGAILAADVAGYSRLMQGDDQATVAMLDVCREIFRESIEEHGGRVVDMAGDSVLAVFETATGAVHAACEIQGKLVEPNAGLPEERRMQFRIGINLGEVIEKTDGTLYGDGVNIAARLESLAEPGGVTISASVFDQVRNRLQLGFDFIGEQAVKNIAEPVRAYRIVGEEVASIASKPPSAGRGGTSGHRSLLLGSTVAILALVVGAWLWKTAPSSQPPSSAIEPVAVLPFKNLSGDPAQDYFADGITEELIGIFNHIEHMQIVGHSKTRALKGKEVDTQALGRELGARYLVEGSVRRIADVVRISSQLINTETGTQEWAETYQNDLNPNNILDVQHEIATRIAVAIGGDLGAVALQKLQVARLKAPEDLSAYECHLRYRRYQNTLTADAHKVARDCLEQVVEAEPQYAQAWIDLVQIYVDGDR